MKWKREKVFAPITYNDEANIGHGFTAIAPVDIMDAEGEIKITVKDDKWIKYDLVGSHIANYDYMINLAHFKKHS